MLWDQVGTDKKHERVVKENEKIMLYTSRTRRTKIISPTSLRVLKSPLRTPAIPDNKK